MARLAIADDNAGGGRLAIGLAQGLALYGLYRAAGTMVWPATQPALFAGLDLAAAITPLLIIQGLTSLRARTLALWAMAASLVAFGIGYWSRERLMALSAPTHPGDVLPVPQAVIGALAVFFIAQALIVAAERAGRWIAPYPEYFDTAWKQGVQVALSAVFAGVFWLVLALGAGLFALIKLTFLRELIHHAWFAIPATALATAAALHLTDTSTSLIAGVRSMALVLLSWLLPLAALLAAGFLVSLTGTGLAPLWQTRAAAALLLWSAAGLIVLINAAWQAGPPAHVPALVLRVSGNAAALLLLPLVLLAAYALMLRVSQYGWTGSRVIGAAAAWTLFAYAVGYGWAALNGSILRHRWLAGLAPVNIAASVLVLSVLLALLSPIADPARIAVGSQVARLTAGKIAPDKFDFAFLRFQSGRFGYEALTALSKLQSGPNAAAIRSAAAGALNAPFPAYFIHRPFAQLTVYPKGYTLPPSLLKQDWQTGAGTAPECLYLSGQHCDVFPAELTGAPPDQFLFVSSQGLFASVVEQDRPDHWRVAGTLNFPLCPQSLQAMKEGQYAVVAPVPPRYRDIEAGGVHYQVQPFRTGILNCP